MEEIIVTTLDRLDLGDAARGVWDVLAGELTPVLRGGDQMPLLSTAETAARGVGLSREASVGQLLEGYMLGCDAIARALGTDAEGEASTAASRLAQLRPAVMMRLASGYAAGLQDTIEQLERQAVATSPVDDFTGAMKPDEIVDRLSLEVLRCQRMDLSLGVVGMAVEVPGEESGCCSRDELTEAQREVGSCLRDSLRRYDSIGLTRSGGFLLVLPDVSRRGLAAAADRLRREIEECVGQWPQLVLALAHYDYVDVGPVDMIATLERSLDEARDQGASLAWAA